MPPGPCVRRTIVVSCLLVLAGSLGTSGAAAGATGVAALHPTTASSGRVVVPVRILGGQGTTTGARPIVEVRVGNSAPVPVLLDSGSSGLRIFDTAVRSGPASGVVVSSQRSTIAYAGGHRFAGVVATAVVSIGSQRTAAPVRFGLVRQASCRPSMPACPAAGGMAGFERYGGYGILGIGTESSRPDIVSPILGMPGALGRSWSLHLDGGHGQLVLGASLPTPSATVTSVSMRHTGTSGGHALWADDQLPLCLTAGTTQGCGPALFDSGTYTMQLHGRAFGSVATSSGKVRSGTSIAVSVRGARDPFWRFTAGTTKSENLLTARGGRQTFVNVGVQGFYRFTVTYDETKGTVLLAPAGT